MNNKIKYIQNILKDENIDVLIIPDGDPHLSEYVANHWKVREWLSGFTGSSGTLVISSEKAGLWTDSRYFIQAEAELRNTGIELFKVIRPEDSYTNWIKTTIPDSSTISIDGRLISEGSMRPMKKSFSHKSFTFLTESSVIEKLWIDRPTLPTEKVFIHDDRLTGLKRHSKIAKVKAELIKQNADWLLITALDDIAWLFNLRGRDVQFNPVFYAYALLGSNITYLFIDQSKLSAEISKQLLADDIVIKDYKSILESNHLCKGKIAIDVNDCNTSLYKLFDADNIIEIKNPIRSLKALKSKHEVKHIENAMIKDGIALTHAFYWLEHNINAETITEYDFANKLTEYRSQQEGYFGESFPAIIGYNENGAIVHYRPNKSNSKIIHSSGILLCDSGGQYTDGTTDITRTMALDEPTTEQKNSYTLVLKGHISLDTAIFPEGTTGNQLDALARQYLWSAGKNYGHGTGHGVGFFLNVHEPPQGYSPGNSIRATTALKVGMFSSNEPGYYEAGEYGIRIENLILVEKSKYNGFLKHRNLTLFPIDTKLIELDLMSEADILWLNNYHHRVFNILSPHLDENHRLWLKNKCEAI